jgi:uncharacterized membrane protein YGL010W
MRSVDQWLDEYGESHRHPVNKALHWACVPPIVLTVLGLLWSIPVPAAFAAVSPWLNWATLVAALAIVYYAVLSPALAAGLVPVIALLLAGVVALGRLPWPLWQSCLAIFVVAWIGQFVGHAFEGRRPSFFKDVQFLLIGPLWLLAAVYRALGLRYSHAPRTRTA